MIQLKYSRLNKVFTASFCCCSFQWDVPRNNNTSFQLQLAMSKCITPTLCQKIWGEGEGGDDYTQGETICCGGKGIWWKFFEKQNKKKKNEKCKLSCFFFNAVKNDHELQIKTVKRWRRRRRIDGVGQGFLDWFIHTIEDALGERYFFFKREMCVARDAFQLEYRKNNAIIFLVQHVSGYLFSLKEIVGCTSRYVWFSSSWSRIELQTVQWEEGNQL